MKIECLPESLTRQRIIDCDGYVTPRYLVDLNAFKEGEFIAYEQLLDSKFWRHQSAFLTEFARVRVIGRNHAFDVELTVAERDSALGIVRMEDNSLGTWPTQDEQSVARLNARRLSALAEAAAKAGPTWLRVVN